MRGSRMADAGHASIILRPGAPARHNKAEGSPPSRAQVSVLFRGSSELLGGLRHSPPVS